MREEFRGKGLLLPELCDEPSLWWRWGDGKASPWFGDITGLSSVPASVKAVVLLSLGVNDEGMTDKEDTHREYKSN